MVWILIEMCTKWEVPYNWWRCVLHRLAKVPDAIVLLAVGVNGRSSAVQMLFQ